MSKEFSPGKIALKTLITLIVLSLFIVSAFSVFFPKEMGKITGRMGMPTLSARFYKAHYEHTKDINDLAKCVNSSIYAGEHPQVEKYGLILQNHEKYGEFVEFVNNNSELNGEYHSYLTSNIILSTYENKNSANAMLFVQQQLETGNYTSVGFLLTNEIVSEKDSETAKSLLILYDSYFNKLDSESQKNLCVEALLLSKTFDTENESLWLERYNNI